MLAVIPNSQMKKHKPQNAQKLHLFFTMRPAAAWHGSLKNPAKNRTDHFPAMIFFRLITTSGGFKRKSHDGRKKCRVCLPNLRF
jgi:hypothetical protein